jgi:phosphoribosylaminoimidazolecarboxamide formyltransferase/IMP cyclohydrolase
MTKRALLSVSDKTGIEDAARRLRALGYELISTGGTHALLAKAGIPALSAEDVTHFPECLGGRVKTMHPLLLGGVLIKAGDAEHEAQAKELGIQPVGVVICNLYPFRKTMEVIEQIDVGGPTMLRSAAKNHASVTVVCDPSDYGRVLAQLETGDTTPELRTELAGKVFLHTAAYDAMIAEYVSGGIHSGVLLTQGTQLRYGENPHQWGKYYQTFGVQQDAETSDSWGILHQGKPLSYLNILDADGAWSAACAFAEPTAVLVKHANPSGIASHASIDEAFQRAYDADRLSAFGVIIAVNRTCTAVIARKILDQKIFVEVVVAPGYEPEALEILQAKPNIRVITQAAVPRPESVQYRSVLGGMLVQNPDTKTLAAADLRCITKAQPTPEQIDDLLFAWTAVKYAKSNAIVLAKDRTTLGIGCGQTSRVDSTWIALKRAGDKAKGSVLASDAFFPFADSLEEAAKQGIAAVIQPGGSVRDEEVFKRADELGLVMLLTGVRAFRH